MTKKEKNNILATIDNEGFDYGFANYSSFDEIKDKEFHELREKYLEARENLAVYIGCEEY